VIVTRADDGNIFVTWALHIITGSNPQVWTQNKLGRHEKLSFFIFEALKRSTKFVVFWDVMSYILVDV
jgi:hypothetical protein